MSTTDLTFVLTAVDKASGVFDGVGGSANRLDNTFKGIASGVAAWGIGDKLLEGTQAAIASASDLSETVNKAGVIFGDQADEMNAWADTADRALGLSKQGALESAASYGNMFQQLGFAGDQATAMSQDVVKLAADLGSFNNLPTEDVLERLAGGFRGEYDSLQQLIPNINAARVEQEALAETHKTSAKDLTAAEKAAATLAIVQKDGAAAADDFAETSGGLANSQKIAAAEFTNLKATLGEQLAPVMAGVVHIASDLLKWAQEHPTATKVLIGVIGGLALGFAALNAVQSASSALSVLRAGSVAAETAATATGTAVNTGFAASMWAVTWPILAVVAALAAVGAAVYLVIDNWDTIGPWLKGVWDGIAGWATGVWESVTGWFSDIGDGIKSAIGTAMDFVREAFSWSPLGFIVDHWGDITGFFSGIWDGVVNGFKNAMRGVALLWNNTLGEISFTTPSWIPLIGGKTFSMPQMPVPQLASGAVLTAPTLFLGGEGGEPEAVVPLSRAGDFGFGSRGDDRPVEVVVQVDGRELLRAVRRAELREP